MMKPNAIAISIEEVTCDHYNCSEKSTIYFDLKNSPEPPTTLCKTHMKGILYELAKDKGAFASSIPELVETYEQMASGDLTVHLDRGEQG